MKGWDLDPTSYQFSPYLRFGAAGPGKSTKLGVEQNSPSSITISISGHFNHPSLIKEENSRVAK